MSLSGCIQGLPRWGSEPKHEVPLVKGRPQAGGGPGPLGDLEDARVVEVRGMWLSVQNPRTIQGCPHAPGVEPPSQSECESSALA